MPQDLTDASEFTAPVTAPEDGDDVDAESVVTALQALANRTKRLLDYLSGTGTTPGGLNLGGALAATDGDFAGDVVIGGKVTVDEQVATFRIGGTVAMGDDVVFTELADPSDTFAISDSPTDHNIGLSPGWYELSLCAYVLHSYSSGLVRMYLDARLVSDSSRIAHYEGFRPSSSDTDRFQVCGPTVLFHVAAPDALKVEIESNQAGTPSFDSTYDSANTMNVLTIRRVGPV